MRPPSMKHLVFALALLHAAGARATGTMPVGTGINVTCSAAAPTPAGTPRYWTLCANGHAFYTDSSNVDHDLEAGSMSCLVTADCATGYTCVSNICYPTLQSAFNAGNTINVPAAANGVQITTNPSPSPSNLPAISAFSSLTDPGTGANIGLQVNTRGQLDGYFISSVGKIIQLAQGVDNGASPGVAFTDYNVWDTGFAVANLPSARSCLSPAAALIFRSGGGYPWTNCGVSGTYIEAGYPGPGGGKGPVTLGQALTPLIQNGLQYVDTAQAYITTGANSTSAPPSIYGAGNAILFDDTNPVLNIACTTGGTLGTAQFTFQQGSGTVSAPVTSAAVWSGAGFTFGFTTLVFGAGTYKNAAIQDTYSVSAQNVVTHVTGTGPAVTASALPKTQFGFDSVLGNGIVGIIGGVTRFSLNSANGQLVSTAFTITANTVTLGGAAAANQVSVNGTNGSLTVDGQLVTAGANNANAYFLATSNGAARAYYGTDGTNGYWQAGVANETMNIANSTGTPQFTVDTSTTPSGAVTMTGKLVSYAALATTGLGISIIQARGVAVASTGGGAQSTTVATFAPIDAANYLVTGTVSCTTADTVTMTVTWVDKVNATAQTRTVLNAQACGTNGSLDWRAEAYTASGTNLIAQITNSSQATTKASAFIRRLD